MAHAQGRTHPATHRVTVACFQRLHSKQAFDLKELIHSPPWPSYFDEVLPTVAKDDTGFWFQDHAHVAAEIHDFGWMASYFGQRAVVISGFPRRPRGRIVGPLQYTWHLAAILRPVIYGGKWKGAVVLTIVLDQGMLDTPPLTVFVADFIGLELHLTRNEAPSAQMGLKGQTNGNRFLLHPWLVLATASKSLEHTWGLCPASGEMSLFGRRGHQSYDRGCDDQHRDSGQALPTKAGFSQRDLLRSALEPQYVQYRDPKSRLQCAESGLEVGCAVPPDRCCDRTPQRL
ncbi:hypothetical protein BJV78DRAFT_1156201 [Lactifluus subvellereus]|nr:hypothetical protein BJV78DRAFT_1156201 [Lactifluus subvellereus]